MMMVAVFASNRLKVHGMMMVASCPSLPFPQHKFEKERERRQHSQSHNRKIKIQFSGETGHEAMLNAAVFTINKRMFNYQVCLYRVAVSILENTTASYCA